ncbi:excisionase family DNA binding protein [Micromonospora palomenae]|uniref:Excisionase family DNA binding protein n=1 Tax=Micromonospora palomenae TaxID=1461247 RepID=A0A561WWB4_9ACTN|nr:helix-turn-helix domain-containing protein [Micromonospora palomenae]TWG28153.1 excisionase family DNA binding protein [Micromonospora palomenae]
MPPATPAPNHRAAHYDDPDPRLYTPAEAAALLRVSESWLRRRAGRRQIPCTFLGKHLRFSAADLAAIIAAAAEPATGRRPNRRRRRPPTTTDLPRAESHASITDASHPHRTE